MTVYNFIKMHGKLSALPFYIFTKKVTLNRKHVLTMLLFDRYFLERVQALNLYSSIFYVGTISYYTVTE